MRRLYYSDDEFSKVFSDKLKDFSVAPPAGNWAAISSKLNQRTVKRYSFLKWSGAIIGSFILLGSIIYYTTYKGENAYLAQKALRNQQEAYATTNPNPANAVNANSVNNIIAPKKADDKQPLLIESPAITGSKVPVTTSEISQAIQNINKAISRIEVASSPAQPIAEREILLMEAVQGLDKNYVSTSPIVPVAEVIEMKADIESSTPGVVNAIALDNETTVIKHPLITRDCSNTNLKLYGGITANPQYTFLLSGTVLNSPSLHYKFSPGYSYGIVLGYNIFPKLAVEVNGIISSENENYSSSDQINKRLNVPIQTANEWIHLNYFRVPVLFKYKFATSGSKCVCDESFNVVGGMEYGRFQGGRTFDGTTTYNLSDDNVKQNDVQLIVGVEREKALSKHIVLNTGLRFAYSTSEIADTHSLRINELYKPHNLNSAITISLSYR